MNPDRHPTPRPTIPCPHCGRDLQPGAGQYQHIAVCLANPEFFATVKAALDDGSGAIVGKLAYKQRPREQRPISSEALLSQIPGYAWWRVAEHFGLRAHTRAVSRRGPSVKAPEVTVSQVTKATEPIYVCGMLVCRVRDYGSQVGLVLR